jgi:hypothetical protein
MKEKEKKFIEEIPEKKKGNMNALVKEKETKI